MNLLIGIRREDINKWEKRVPLIPSHARELVDRLPIEIRVQPSGIRIFTDDDYRRSGLPVGEDLSPCPIVMALKEIPIERIEKNKVYVFFSHTAKGQSHNMPMLKKMMDSGCTIIDYERMVNDKGQRVLYFGNYAGHAGMVDTLWALGRRLDLEGLPNPFTLLRPTHEYKSLVEVKEAVGQLAWTIIRKGLPKEIAPLAVGFFGYGHVSGGAQEILDILPVETIRARDLPGLAAKNGDSLRKIYKVVFMEEDMVEPTVPGARFDLQDYYANPRNYRSVVEKYVPYLTALVNGIYWTPKYPRFITKAFLKKLYAPGERPRLRVIGDITCDIDGSIECTVEATNPDDPVYVYDPARDKAVPGFEGAGPVVMAVYNLPAELPLESSTYFSLVFKDHVPAIARADYRTEFEACGLPDVLRRAVILYRGRLTPDYAYLSRHLQ